MHWTNQREKEAEEKGYIIVSWYDTKDEIDHVLSQLHGMNIRAMKAHHHDSRPGAEYDFWVLWVKREDFHKLHPDYKPPVKPEKKPQRGGRRKDMALRIIKMRDEDKMSWEDIAKATDRSYWTVQRYYYWCKRGELTEWKKARTSQCSESAY